MFGCICASKMIEEAITSLKERTGSSQYAITKFIEGKHKELPPTYKKLVLLHLKKSVAAGKLVKVKNSFKLASNKPAAPVKAAAAVPKKPKTVTKPTAKAAAKPKDAPKKKAAAKPKAKTAAATAKPKPKAKPAKAAAKKVAAKPAKKTPVKKPKSVVKKPKSVKSPAKKAKK